MIEARAFGAPLIRHIRNSIFAIFEIQVKPAAQRFPSPQDCYFHTDIWRLPVTVVSSAYAPAARTHSLPLKTLALLFGFVLGAFLCVATYGLDLSPGFF